MWTAAVAHNDNNVNNNIDDSSNTSHKSTDLHYTAVLEPFHIKCIINSEFNTQHIAGP